MLGRVPYNLNAIAHDTTIALVKRVIEMGVNLTELYVDTVGKENVYQEMLEGIFPQLKIVVTSKADVKFPIVSAASICAKVTRDRVMDEWQFTEKGTASWSRDFGSGYPGDPITKKWLAQAGDAVFGFPSIVRYSWGTAKKIMDSDHARVEWEDENSDDDDGTASVMTFFSKNGQDVLRDRHRIFHSARLSRVSGI